MILVADAASSPEVNMEEEQIEAKGIKGIKRVVRGDKETTIRRIQKKEFIKVSKEFQERTEIKMWTLRILIRS